MHFPSTAALALAAAALLSLLPCAAGFGGLARLPLRDPGPLAPMRACLATPHDQMINQREAVRLARSRGEEDPHVTAPLPLRNDKPWQWNGLPDTIPSGASSTHVARSRSCEY
mmetsp:Transcript_14131/g.34557  ORF Transcript_14131/g.34557 Transcript_14131/m.34557 type:complete len:113 (+) Transcript_14131:48-386(+)|eukprot:CAMPEP_0206248102 /NCGR_PEP_ID=MMETSP0047_2-20121206/20184_1 /ASSEMBLY_ACC=CAM_ASM_000192 /TAXON_ID=195065 /ORGANISM="Chroomonas mesostigmatica_cf, Strain CCMP1168" /LENGTH=112 /DNA_ID=CAMNT_0053673711 /DNA_START=43 /DNA_END=381 /DNA_ORIENTATION=+